MKSMFAKLKQFFSQQFAFVAFSYKIKKNLYFTSETTTYFFELQVELQLFNASSFYNYFIINVNQYCFIFLKIIIMIVTILSF